jgi:hypothetical protein
VWESILVWAYAVIIWFGVPAAIIWGWARWSIQKKKLTTLSAFSLAGFIMATASAILAIVSVAYANMGGDFAFFDPRLLRIYYWGGILSLAGILFGLVGVWRGNSLRWHAPLCAFGMLVFWLMSAEGE